MQDTGDGRGSVDEEWFAGKMNVPRSIIEGLERSLARVPIEEAKRIARQAHRVLEKEWRPLKPGSDRLPLLAKKIQDLRDAELAQIELAMRRLEYLDRVLKGPEDDPLYRNWIELKYYRILADYLARCGRFDEALSLAAKFDIEVLARLMGKVLARHSDYQTMVQDPTEPAASPDCRRLAVVFGKQKPLEEAGQPLGVAAATPGLFGHGS